MLHDEPRFAQNRVSVAPLGCTLFVGAHRMRRAVALYRRANIVFQQLEPRQFTAQLAVNGLDQQLPSTGWGGLPYLFQPPGHRAYRGSPDYTKVRKTPINWGVRWDLQPWSALKSCNGFGHNGNSIGHAIEYRNNIPNSPTFLCCRRHWRFKQLLFCGRGLPSVEKRALLANFHHADGCSPFPTFGTRQVTPPSQLSCQGIRAPRVLRRLSLTVT